MYTFHPSTGLAVWGDIFSLSLVENNNSAASYWRGVATIQPISGSKRVYRRAAAGRLDTGCALAVARVLQHTRNYVPTRTAEGAWEATGAGDDFPVESAFVPSEYGDSAERTQARLRQVLAGRFLLFGRRLGGFLPQPAYPADDAASVSPLWFASRPKLPPMLLLTGGADQVVPCDQTTRFAEAARGAGNDVTQLIFEEAGHGGGAVNCAAGRRATLDFLRSNGLLTGPERESDDPRSAGR